MKEKKKKYLKPKLTERSLNKFFFACQCPSGHGSARGCTSTLSKPKDGCPVKGPGVSLPWGVRPKF
jgi:hypothetical protein